MTGSNQGPNHSIWGHFLVILEGDGKGVISCLVGCIRDNNYRSKTHETGGQLIIATKSDRSQAAWTQVVAPQSIDVRLR